MGAVNHKAARWKGLLFNAVFIKFSIIKSVDIWAAGFYWYLHNTGAAEYSFCLFTRFNPLCVPRYKCAAHNALAEIKIPQPIYRYRSGPCNKLGCLLPVVEGIFCISEKDRVQHYRIFGESF